jgi:hypothetical protein
MDKPTPLPTRARGNFSRPPSPFQIEAALAEALRGRKQLLEIDPTIADDPKAYADTLEGITDDWVEELHRCIEGVQKAEDYQQVIGQRIAELEKRRARFKAQEKHWRSVALRMLELLDVRRFERPEYTLSMRPGAAHVQLTDETLLPPEFQRVTVEADKAALLKALKAGETVPGAVLSNPQLTLYLTER